MVHVGIFIKHGILTDGATQQGIFLYECLTKAKIKCSLVVDTDQITHDNDYTKIHYPAHSHALADLERLFELDVLLCVSLFLIQTDTLRALRRNGVRMVLYNCGNRFMAYQEAIVGTNALSVRVVENISAVGNFYSEMWTIPNYTTDSGFYRCLIQKDIPFREAPYVWSPSLMPPVPPYEHFEGDTSYVIIMEWNKQVTKTCLIPLLGCDRLHRRGRHKIRVWLFCAPSSKGFRKILEMLAVPVDCYPPVRYPEVIKQMRQKKLNGFLFSHQIHNALNFLHMETFYFGCPLVHNCPLYNGAGYFYPGNDAAEGANQLQRAIETHHHDPQTRAVQNILNQMSPETNAEMYKNMISSLQ